VPIINTAEYEMILRVPGIGVGSAKKIVSARRFASLSFDHLRQIGVVLKRARYFITCQGKSLEHRDADEQLIRRKILSGASHVRDLLERQQLNLFNLAS
jgi:predicted DNA-binding helix-hairpin-helix protein